MSFPFVREAVAAPRAAALSFSGWLFSFIRVATTTLRW